jgi:transposase-like protein
MHAPSLLRRVLEACTNKPTFRVDRGPWHPEALRALGLRIMKARTRRSFNNLLARRKPILEVKSFMRLLALWYNFIRIHQTLKPQRHP